MSEKLVTDTISDLQHAQHTLARLQGDIEQQHRRNEEATREIARLHDMLRDVYGAVYIRLDGSVKQGTVYADRNGGPMREVREAVLDRLPPVRANDGNVPAAPMPRPRYFRLLAQVGKLYVYGEV